MKGILKKSHDAHIDQGFLTGKLLVATPHQQDPEQEQTVVYICGHDEEGAIGLVINKNLSTLNFEHLLKQLEINATHNTPNFVMHYGGPVEETRGFVLHSSDYESNATITVSSEISVTATMDVLREMAKGRGPKQRLVALGYSGWDNGQLEREIHDNAWLVMDATRDIIFNEPVNSRWKSSYNSLGINPLWMSLEAGNA